MSFFHSGRKKSSGKRCHGNTTSPGRITLIPIRQASNGEAKREGKFKLGCHESAWQEEKATTAESHSPDFSTIRKTSIVNSMLLSPCKQKVQLLRLYKKDTEANGRPLLQFIPRYVSSCLETPLSLAENFLTGGLSSVRCRPFLLCLADCGALTS